jgi:hypothetical protein
MTKRLASLLILLLGLAGAGWLVVLALTSPKLVLLREPIDLSKHTIVSSGFVPDESGTYSISIRFEDHGRQEEVACLVGTGTGYPFDPKGCAVRSALSIRWTLYGRDRLWQLGHSDQWKAWVDFPREGGVDRLIGWLNGSAGTMYSLKLQPETNLADLNRYHPALFIEAGEPIRRRGELAYPFMALVSGVLIFCGTYFLILSERSRKRQKEQIGGGVDQ